MMGLESASGIDTASTPCLELIWAQARARDSLERMPSRMPVGVARSSTAVIATDPASEAAVAMSAFGKSPSGHVTTMLETSRTIGWWSM